jgi:cell division protein FtsB
VVFVKELAIKLFPNFSFRYVPQVVVVLLVVGLTGAMAIEPTRQLFEQRARIAEMSSDLQELNRSNRRLERRIVRLNDPDYLEREAREQIGLVRPGETGYVVMLPKGSKPKRHRKVEAHPHKTAPPTPGFGERLFRFLGVP